MPGDLLVTSVVPVRPSQPPRTNAYQAARGAASPPNQHAAVDLATMPHPVNPDFHLDAALNIAVLQYFNANGDVTQSIPSQKQLDAYRAEGGVTPMRSPLQPVGKVL